MCGTNGYVLSAISQRTHGCPQDTRVSHLRRILPHRARPDAERRRTRPRAADARRQRESAGERAHRAQSRGKGRTCDAYTVERQEETNPKAHSSTPSATRRRKAADSPASG